MHNVLRRGGERGGAASLAFGCGWAFHPGRRCLVGAGGRRATLTAAEVSIMAALCEAPGRPVSREVLAARMGRRLAGPDDRGIDVLVSRIRRKLAAHGEGDLIRSIRNVGYMLDADVSARSDDQ